PLVGEKTRVSGTGWSTSAAVALAASSALFGFGARAASTVRVAVAFYPICSTTEASELTGSVLFLPGGGDPLTPPDRCVRSVRRRKTRQIDRKSTRLNSSHEWISYAVFCLKKKKTINLRHTKQM